MIRRVVSALPAVVVAGLALAAAPAQVKTALERLRESPRGIARTADTAGRDVRGDAYADALAEAAARIPWGGSYGIADGGSPGPDTNWVRCDLAPRVPVLLRSRGCGDWFFERRPKEVPELTVVVGRDGGLRVVPTRTLLSSLWSGLTGPQEDIPGWMDTPAEGRTVAGGFVVGGWCQERGGRPCPSVRVWIDGVEVDAARVERFPRRDVQAVLPEMGDCSRAGWRVTIAAGALAKGRHCVAAALIATGGRHRRVGPWAFEVAE